jgi:hypothetical protein
MPTHNGLRSDDRDGIEDRWKPTIQLDEEQAIPIREVGHAPSAAMRSAERRSAAFSASSRLFDLNGETKRVRKKQSSAIIAADVRRFSYLINTDEVFGTHRGGLRFEPLQHVLNPGPTPAEPSPASTRSRRCRVASGGAGSCDRTPGTAEECQSCCRERRPTAAEMRPA